MLFLKHGSLRKCAFMFQKIKLKLLFLNVVVEGKTIKIKFRKVKFTPLIQKRGTGGSEILKFEIQKIKILTFIFEILSRRYRDWKKKCTFYKLCSDA